MANTVERDLQTWWASRQSADMIQWVRVSAEMTETISSLANRPGLVAVVEPGAAAHVGAPAFYDPDQAHVAIDTNVCAPGEDPADIHLDTATGELRHPALVGAGDHESAHGHSVYGTRWKIDQDLERRSVVRAALLLEEPRIEKYHLIANPQRRIFLRAAFHDLVHGNAAVDTMWHAAHTAALCAGRVDAGVLDLAEVAPLIDRCTEVLGVDVYNRLQEIWLEALDLTEPTVEEIEALGQRWLDVLEEAGAGEDPEESLVLVCRSPGGESGDGESDGDGESFAAAVSAAAREEASQAADAADARREAAERAADAASRARAERKAAEVFNLELPIGHSKGHGDEALTARRVPTGIEMAQADLLAMMIAKARFREHSRTTVHTSAPPGRLNTAKALKRSAEIAVGLPPTTQQWRRTRRSYTERPPLTVGIGCDISGSMRYAAPAVASACWVLARAVHRNDGRLAAVAYGERVHPVVLPGSKPGQVQPFRALGGSEDWVGAMQALDGGLRLRDSSGVRLAVFLSDGRYTSGQRSDGDSMAAMWMARGVKVLWLGFNGADGWDGDRPAPGATYVHLSDPQQVGSTIGKALVELLERA